MKLRRLFSLLLSVLIIASTASVCLITTTSAAETETAETGAKLGSYYNVDYLEKEAKAYLDTQADMSETNLGATYTPQATTWRVWSPTATKIQLKLYTTGSDMESGAKLIGKYDMTKDAKTSVWSYTLNGDQKDVYYTYLITNPNGTKETFDIYAKAAGVNGDRSMVVDLDSTDPDGWNNDKHVFPDRMTDEALWEVHIADLTSNDNSGVDKNYQGKFLGFAEGGLTYNGKSVGIDYLVEQGIKAVHIQCPFDFASGDETNPLSYNWGYDPKNYNLPEGMYSTNPYDGNVRINEFKQLIQALHDRGITVIMGVVYNHTYVTEQSAFSYTVPGYYYRMSSGTFYINGTGCGNTLASDKAMFRSYMLNSLKYWVEEYHIDGFRFDLMACHDTETMNMIRDMFNGMLDGEGKKIIMYGEPWTGGGSSGLTSTYESSTPNFGKLSANIAGFSDQVRNSIQSVFTGTGSVSSSKDGIKGGSMGKYPNQSINYFDCHDGPTWWDRIVGSNFDSTSAEHTAKLRTSFTYLWTAQGIPFTLAGTEFARTKYGHSDSYNLGDINAFDWKRIETYANEVAYAKGMREIRSAFSPFREADTRNVPEYLTTSNTSKILAYSRNNTKAGEWSKAVVILNTGAAGTVTLPAGTWTIVANGEKAGLTSLGTATGTYNVGANGSAVLVQGTTSAKTAEFETITINHYVGEELLKTSSVKYEVGTTWRATPDAYTIFDHSVTKIENNAGTKDGNCVYGTVEKGQDVVVSFYYKQETTSGYLTVKYVNEAGESISSDVTYRLKNGSEYNVPFENIAGFELVSDKYPNNFKGIFDAANPATISFVYKQIASDKITVYYYDALGATSGLNLRMYAYTEQMDESTGDVEKPLGGWNVKNQNMKKVTDINELPAGEELGKWYKYVIDDSTVQMKDENGNPRKFASCKVMFLLSNNSKQEPLNGEAGYDASGTIYVKNKIVTFDSKIITSHIDAETGEKLGDDVIKEYNNVTSNEVYLTSPIAKYGKSTAPSNASGNLTAGTTCVVYMYKKNDGPVTGILGDVDGNDAVNVKDATTIQKVVAGLDVAYYDEALADADENNTVNVKDATAIQKWVAGLLTDTNIGTGTSGGNQGGEDDTKTKLTTLYTEASGYLKDKADYVTEKPWTADSDELKAKAEKYGYDIKAEDLSKNEYQKFNTVLTSVSFYVVNGGTDEEIKAALATLEQAYNWFKYYTTELHPEPFRTANPYDIDVSNGQYPIVEGYNTVVFSTKWNTANVYCWNDSGEMATWPGEAMKHALVNDYGENQFVAYIPVDYPNYIINGDGGQTIDLTVTSSIGMYMDKMQSGKYTIGTWEPNFYDYK